MKELEKLVKYDIKAGKKSILLMIFVYSFFCSLFSLGFQKLNMVWVGIVLVLIVTFLFMISLHQFVYNKVRGITQDWKAVFQIPKIEKSHLLILPVLLIIVVLLFVVVYFMSRNPLLVGLVFVFLLTMMIVLNAIFQTYLYLMMEDECPKSERLKRALSVVIGEKKALFHLVVKYVRFIMIGVFLTFSANVFVYAKQLQELLKSPETEPIQKLFASDLSYLVQSTGIQMTVLYIIVYSAFLYAYIHMNAKKGKPKKKK